MNIEFDKKRKNSVESENYCDFLKTIVSYDNDNIEEKVLNKAYESYFEESCSSNPFESCCLEDK